MQPLVYNLSGLYATPQWLLTPNNLYISLGFHMCSKSCVKRPLSKRQKIGIQDQLSINAGQKYCRMLHGEHSAILPTFSKLPFVVKIFVLSIFEWPFYTGFTVYIERTFVSARFILIITTWPHPASLSSLYVGYYKVFRMATTSVNERTDYSDFSLGTPMLMHEFPPNNL